LRARRRHRHLRRTLATLRRQGTTGTPKGIVQAQLAQQHRATHTLLVSVQHQRLMAHPDFERFDLRSFRVKFSTSAPFHAALKADVLSRWPGGLNEHYGLTEGGGTCILAAHLHPDKLHTVGQAADRHDIRLMDEDGFLTLHHRRKDLIISGGFNIDPSDLEAQISNMQRLHDLRLIDELPRSAIGKVLKRELRDAWRAAGRDVQGA